MTSRSYKLVHKEIKLGCLALNPSQSSLFRDKICLIKSAFGGEMIVPIIFDPNIQHSQMSMSQLSVPAVFGLESSGITFQIAEYQQKNIKTIQKCVIILALEGKQPKGQKIEIRKNQIIMMIKDENQIISQNLMFGLNYNQTIISALPRIQSPSIDFGKITSQTEIILEKEKFQKFQLLQDENPEDILATMPAKINIQNMKVGGLDKQIQQIYRRVFATRQLHPTLIKKMGIKHVKGILLYGPPGTGKTLIAREISKLMDVQPKLVNGPEILSEFVGQAEKRVRQLFQQAEKDQQMNGKQGKMHCIVIDEIDSLCGHRNSKNQKVYSLIVNQFLTCIDGVKQKNNILVIGMTNRKDLIDEAILRPGRLQVHIEVKLPDKNGRMQILNIHTEPQSKNNILDPSLQIEKIAELTKNFTGAELQALVKSANQNALARWKKDSQTFYLNVGKKHLITEEDFIVALSYIKPQFGIDSVFYDDILPKNQIKIQKYQKQINQLVNSIKTSQNGKHTYLIQGQPRVGKTFIAVKVAKQANLPYTKILSPTTFLGLSEQEKQQLLVDTFSNAQKCEQSLILLDDFFRLISYTSFDGKYNSLILNTLIDLIKSKDNANRKQIIIMTADINCFNNMLEDMKKLFKSLILVEPLNQEKEITQALTALKILQTGHLNSIRKVKISQLINFSHQIKKDRQNCCQLM